MCRLLVLIKPEEGLQRKSINQFAELADFGVVPPGTSPGHPDGWGVVVYKDGNIQITEKQPESAFRNSVFVGAGLKESFPSLFIAHLRKASIGKNIPENTQPYAYKNFSFCHNGTIEDFQYFPLNEKFSKLRKGTNDSEWIFYYILEQIENNPEMSPEMIFKNFIANIRPLKYTAFNSLFSNGSYLIATREANEKNEWVSKGNLCDNYYTLFIGKAADQRIKVICSQKLDLDGIAWSNILNHALVIVNLQTGQEKVVLT